MTTLTRLVLGLRESHRLRNQAIALDMWFGNPIRDIWFGAFTLFLRSFWRAS